MLPLENGIIEYGLFLGRIATNSSRILGMEQYIGHEGRNEEWIFFGHMDGKREIEKNNSKNIEEFLEYRGRR